MFVGGLAVVVTTALSGCINEPAETDSPDGGFTMQGKTVEILVGQEAGGGHDTTARVIARHIGQYLPGTPEVIVRNMPGGGDKVMANYAYTQAPADGTSVGVFSVAVPHYNLIGEGEAEGVRYDASKFKWFGSPTVTTNVLLVHTRTGITKDNLAPLTQGQGVRIAQRSPGDGPHLVQATLASGLGWKFDTVFGYEGERRLAIERGEVDAIVTTWESLEDEERDLIDEGVLLPVVTVGLSDAPALSAPELSGVPKASDLFKNASPEAQDLLEVILTRYGFARSFGGPPGLSEEAVQAYRTAFDEMNADEDYVKEAEPLYAVVPSDGATVAERITKYVTADPSVVAPVLTQIESDSQ
jgi:tripartite-type tricarboxylate transporter receptor subunit TctC